ncbi:MAG: transporter [Akkermansiaceae bacterium]
MKLISIFIAALITAFGSVLTAGQTASTAPANCGKCTPGHCLCGDNCGCAHDGHDYFTHAPIGVMGDHIHHKGGLMASYRYMFMRMQRNYDGDSQISDAAARARYMMNATDMDMQMHMLGVMYAPTDKFTLMLMGNYLDSSMPMVNMMGVKNIMRTSGYGDTTISGYYSLFREPNRSVHVGLGLSIPTGSIDEEMPNGRNMGYPMQLGSGTYDLKPSITWVGHSANWSYGSQLSAILRLGENDNDYRLGDRVSATGWISRRLNAWSAVSLRLTASTWGDVDGRDQNMAVIPMGPLAGRPMAAPADPNNQGGSRVDLALGLNLWHTESGGRFAIEAGAPIYQHLDGPQLGTEWFMTAGFQFAW